MREISGESPQAVTQLITNPVSATTDQKHDFSALWERVISAETKPIPETTSEKTPLTPQIDRTKILSDQLLDLGLLVVQSEQNQEYPNSGEEQEAAAKHVPWDENSEKHFRRL